jgi:hypothetical protein
MEQAEKQQRLLVHGPIVKKSSGLFGTIISLGEKFVSKTQFVDNLSTIGPNEDLHIIGHGNPLEIGGWTPKSLAEHLVKTLGLPVTYKGMIYLEACGSGEPKVINGQVQDFLTQFQEHLSELGKQTAVTGYHGSVVLDDAFLDLYRKEYVHMRVLPPSVSMAEYKELALKAGDQAHKLELDLIERVSKEDSTWLDMGPNQRRVSDYAFEVYNTLLYEHEFKDNNFVHHIQVVGGSSTVTVTAKGEGGFNAKSGTKPALSEARCAVMAADIMKDAKEWKNTLTGIETFTLEDRPPAGAAAANAKPVSSDVSKSPV